MLHWQTLAQDKRLCVAIFWLGLEVVNEVGDVGVDVEDLDGKVR